MLCVAHPRFPDEFAYNAFVFTALIFVAGNLKVVYQDYEISQSGLSPVKFGESCSISDVDK